MIYEGQTQDYTDVRGVSQNQLRASKDQAVIGVNLMRSSTQITPTTEITVFLEIPQEPNEVYSQTQ